MADITITLPTPHPKQAYILNDPKRFKHLRCGRRFGKTKLIAELCLPALEKGVPVGIWYPTYKDSIEVWDTIKKVYKDVISKKDESLKKIWFLGGGQVDFWAMENPESGQGFKYYRAIVDEAAKASAFKRAWEETIRATLTDYKGDAYIMSRPKPNCYFKELEDKHTGKKNWGFYHFTTYDNPYIDNSEVDEAKEDLDPRTFEQEYLAEYVDPTAKYFFYTFDEKLHVQECSIIESLPIKLSFDFNIDPFTCTVFQTPTDNTMNFIREIQLPNSDIFQMCDHIKAFYPRAFFIATGDRTGYNQTGTKRGKTSYWKIIKRELNLSDSQLKLRSKNLDLIESRVLCNSAFHSKNISIDPSCEKLIRDCKYAIVDDKGVLIKDRSKNTNDMLDCGRYALDSVWPELTRF